MKKIVVLLFLFLFIGCNANLPRQDNHYIKKSETELYNIGIEQYKKKHYKDAIKNFDSLKSIYSHSEFAERSLLYLISIYIKEEKYSDALVLMDELINEYPGYLYNEELHYDHVMTFYKSVEKQLRDNELIVKVKNLLTEFLNNFPNSKYCPDIKKEITNINNRLIYKEIEIGYFYEMQRNYVAALKRYLTAYQYESNHSIKSIYTAELLYRIYYCYLMIGLKNEGIEYLNILNNRFQNTNWSSPSKLLK